MTQLQTRETVSAANTLALVVRSRELVADDCLALVLEKADGSALPSWQAGAHIDLALGNGLTRQYSLCGDPEDATQWRLGILREQAGRGGSAYLHDVVDEGCQLIAQGPRNHFPLVPADSYLFVAGGIGITPILPMIRAAEASQTPWRLLYGGRRQSSMAFVEELGRYGDRVQFRTQEEHGLLDLAGFLASGDSNATAYCCGPESLIAAMETTCGEAGVPLHVERFAARPIDDTTVDTAFEVECAESGVTLMVPAGSSILDVVREAGIDVLSSCSEGTCGTCEVDIVSGVPDHRDSVLTPEERKAGESMMICVSRCIGKRLVLDL
ncbi:PDR/VanB family oxidoreductase [Mycolicibacterium llatzerense]|uniref:PDR/VanB family oxidoreductase n=1 Tax=Mycolicibacterium llatzerense TaxID=280871 RepID=UPI0021B52CFF|nr:PDR/VanB family oxidoreductase [Mycolicibacterium llatzerense]MCT7362734.1 ferredoxin [Mycolicibacterium llatzerense]